MTIKLETLYRYPVKSLHGHSVLKTDVDLIGLRGDRRWLITDLDNRFLTMREHPHMTFVQTKILENGVELFHPDLGSIEVVSSMGQNDLEQVTIWRSTVKACRSSQQAEAFLSAALKQPVKLFYMQGETERSCDPEFAPGAHVSFADGFPILLANSASLAALNEQLELEMSMARFRPNIVFRGAQAWVEDEIKRLRIGEVTFKVLKPCDRCVLTTFDPITAEQSSNNEPLRSLGKIHRSHNGKIMFGQNIVAEQAGVISMNDEVEILETGRSNLRAPQ